MAVVAKVAGRRGSHMEKRRRRVGEGSDSSVEEEAVDEDGRDG